MRQITPQDWAERMVADMTSTEIHTEYVRLSGPEHECLRAAIMTGIALGERKDLEQLFPELAGANPENWDWP